MKTNFAKTRLYSSVLGDLPQDGAAKTLNCEVGHLPVHYLGVTIAGRRPRKQDWEELIQKVRRRLSSWKIQYLSLGGRLTLVNSVLSALPTYWMSIFKLPCWVIKALDRIRRDFLWSGPDLSHHGCRLVGWRSLCRPREQGGWGILDLHNFNMALLGKWWWKFTRDPNWYGASVVQFNYGFSRWNLFPRLSGRISSFWKGVSCCLPAFRSCIVHCINSGEKTFFWKDCWLNGATPMDLWPEAFRNSPLPNGTVRSWLFFLRRLLFWTTPILGSLEIG